MCEIMKQGGNFVLESFFRYWKAIPALNEWNATFWEPGLTIAIVNSWTEMHCEILENHPNWGKPQVRFSRSRGRWERQLKITKKGEIKFKKLISRKTMSRVLNRMLGALLQTSDELGVEYMWICVFLNISLKIDLSSDFFSCKPHHRKVNTLITDSALHPVNKKTNTYFIYFIYIFNTTHISKSFIKKVGKPLCITLNRNCLQTIFSFKSGFQKTQISFHPGH